jgi:NAD(P)-dependent dehydrogenase (short-subunit alcohol dehydrogenase family)
MTWTADDIGRLDGRVAVVTGANGGLGLETAEALAGHGAHVVMAVRNQEKAARAAERIRHSHPHASLELVALDLGDQASVRRCSETVLAAHPVIDLLVNNAGLMAMPESRTADGYEMQFGVNHLGHWTLTALLLPGLIRADSAGRDARVVTVTSVARFTGSPVDEDDPHLRRRYGPWRAYGQAKLANYHFALGLQAHLDEAGVGVKSLLAHPGLSHTDLQTRTRREGGGGMLGALSDRAAAMTGMTPREGARMQLRAATDPRARGGALYAPRYVSVGPPVERPVLRRLGLARATEKLWRVSERETGVALDVSAARAAAGG